VGYVDAEKGSSESNPEDMTASGWRVKMLYKSPDTEKSEEAMKKRIEDPELLAVSMGPLAREETARKIEMDGVPAPRLKRGMTTCKTRKGGG
jgi:hypothetical protein